MNRSIAIFSTLFIAAILLAVSSCRRKDTLQTPFTRMVGTWKEAKFATDDNNNGVIDPYEWSLVESGVDNELLFRQDSTGVETDNSSPPLSFKWRTFDGPTVLIQYHANDTIVYTITEVTSVDLTLTTTTSLGLASYYYVRK